MISCETLQQKNVHHYQFFVNNEIPIHFGNELALILMPYDDVSVKVYFHIDNVPTTFSVSYDALALPMTQRRLLPNTVKTIDHTYVKSTLLDAVVHT